MKRSALVGTVVLPLLSLCLFMIASVSQAASLERFQSELTAAGDIQLRLSFDRPMVAPTGHMIEPPVRLFFDLPGVRNDLGQKNYRLDAQKSIAFAEAEGRTRAIINLPQAVPYLIKASGNDLLITLQQTAQSPVATMSEQPPPSATMPESTDPARPDELEQSLPLPRSSALSSSGPEAPQAGTDEKPVEPEKALAAEAGATEPPNRSAEAKGKQGGFFRTTFLRDDKAASAESAKTEEQPVTATAPTAIDEKPEKTAASTNEPPTGPVRPVLPEPAKQIPAAKEKTPVESPPVADNVRAVPGRFIDEIRFQRVDADQGDVVIQLSQADMEPRVQDLKGSIRLYFDATRLPQDLQARQDVRHFATPVRHIRAVEAQGRTDIDIETNGAHDYLMSRRGRQLMISVRTKQDSGGKSAVTDKRYTGERLSLNFQNIEVRSVLQLLADFTGLNLVASDSVTGHITIRLHNVPWDQALDLILQSKGLGKRRQGNVLLVAPLGEMTVRERESFEAERRFQAEAPLQHELIQVSYARADDIAKLFQSVDVGEDRRGAISIDERTNSLVVNLSRSRIDALRRIVAQLDVPVRQVMIEARIVEATVGYDKSLGVRWSGQSQRGNWRAGASPDASAENGGAAPFVDLGARAATSAFGIGFVTDNTLLDLELSAMEKSGNGEIVSQPRVMTSDKETARILKGEEIPYQEASSSGATSTSFKEAALSLEVTPQITPDNRILVDVKVTKDAANFENALNGVPPINKNEVNAKVLINDGETIVIGGVFNNTRSQSVDKVPVLGDIPYVGRLFRRDIVNDSKNELLVFLTPRILNNQVIVSER